MRLTNKTREQILENWTKKKWESKFNKAVKSLVVELRKQVTCLSDEIDVDKNTFNHLVEKMVVIKETKISLPRWSDFSGFEFQENSNKPFFRPVDCEPYYTRYGSGSTQVRPCDKQWKKLTDVRKKYREDRYKISSILYSVTTDAKLFELIPECKKYMPKIESNKGTQIIAVDAIKEAAALM